MSNQLLLIPEVLSHHPDWTPGVNNAMLARKWWYPNAPALSRAALRLQAAEMAADASDGCGKSVVPLSNPDFKAGLRRNEDIGSPPNCFCTSRPTNGWRLGC